MLNPRIPWPTPTRIAEWDLVRSVFIARGSYTVGCVDADQAWSLLFDDLRIARREYGNWRQLADAYFLGYMIWQAQSDLASRTESVTFRAALTVAMNTMPSSPWRRVALHPDGDVGLF